MIKRSSDGKGRLHLARATRNHVRNKAISGAQRFSNCDSLILAQDFTRVHSQFCHDFLLGVGCRLDGFSVPCLYLSLHRLFYGFYHIVSR